MGMRFWVNTVGLYCNFFLNFTSFIRLYKQCWRIMVEFAGNKINRNHLHHSAYRHFIFFILTIITSTYC